MKKAAAKKKVKKAATKAATKKPSPRTSGKRATKRLSPATPRAVKAPVSSKGDGDLSFNHAMIYVKDVERACASTAT